MVDPKFIAEVLKQLWELLRPKLEELYSRPRVPRRLLTVEEAAAYIGRTEPALRQLIHKQQLIVVRRGRRVHLDIADLNRFIELNKRYKRRTKG
jgi:excisionase family DNA binding protein